MKRSKFTDSQIMDTVKRVQAGFTVPDICRELGISTVIGVGFQLIYDCPHKVESGAAQMPSPKGIVSSPSYSRIPILN